MIHLMLEDTSNVMLRQGAQELWVVNHFELSGLFVNTNAGSLNALISTLLNLAAETSKERLVHQQSISVAP
jgi:hypothetical protein